MAYHLPLPMNMSKIHNVFHVSILKKYIPNPTHVLEMQLLQLEEELTCEEEPVKILDEKSKY